MKSRNVNLCFVNSLKGSFVLERAEYYRDK